MGIIFTISASQWFLLPTLLLDADLDDEGGCSLTLVFLCFEIGIFL